MSTSATLPLSSVDFNGANSLPPQQNVFSNLLGQLSQAILAGSLTQTQTYLNALSAMSPSTMSAKPPPLVVVNAGTPAYVAPQTMS